MGMSISRVPVFLILHNDSKFRPFVCKYIWISRPAFVLNDIVVENHIIM